MNVCYTALIAITAKCITFNVPFRQWPVKTKLPFSYCFYLFCCFVLFSSSSQIATFLMSISLYDGKYRSVS